MSMTKECWILVGLFIAFMITELVDSMYRWEAMSMTDTGFWFIIGVLVGWFASLFVDKKF